MSPGGGDKHKTRTLIVHKDDGGYGLTLSGDKPTRVQTVRTSGASHRAGVREGDVIIKVNGQQVTESDHNEVVKLIQTGSYVALTVIHTSRILDPNRSHDQPTTIVDRRESSAARSPTAITSPQPASDAILKKTQTNNQATLQLMLEEKTREVEEIKSQLVRSNSKKLRNKLEVAETIQADLQNKIRQSTLEFSEPRFGPLPPTPTHGGTTPLTPSPGGSSAPSSAPSRLSSVCGDLTPVAPPRSESLTFSVEAPPLPARNTAPTPPPRNPVVAGLPPPPPKMPRHSSHENINQTGGAGRRSSTAAQPSPARDAIQHTRTRSSPCSLEQTLEVATSMEAITPRYETPPGTPPPPYNAPDPALVTWGGLTAGGGGVDIMTMEDESDDDDVGVCLQSQALPPEGDHGPYNSLTELLQHGAHLAVFLNYVISNADPAPLLFFLITDAYKQGTPKEMRKWAYEIHSCFLVPRAPLEIPNLDTQVIAHIDTFLAEIQEREESLLKLFWKVRSKARDKLKFQLDAFRAKRALGMGNIFGPSDPELKAAEENPIKRNQIIEDTLLPLFDTMADDFENATDRQSTLCSSLATVLVKTFTIRSTQAIANIEKIPMFVSKEKRRERLFGRVLKKNLTVKGHNFYLRHYDQVTMCTQSHEIIWGIGPQGYRCQNCDFDVHKKIVHQVEEACVGPNKDQPKNKKIRNSLINLGFPSRLSDVGRIMSKDQLTVLEKDRKTSSVSPSSSMRGPADLPSNFRSYTSDLSTPEDQTDQSATKQLENDRGSLGSRLGDSATRSDLWSSRPEIGRAHV